MALRAQKGDGDAANSYWGKTQAVCVFGLSSFLLIGFWFDRTDEKGQAMNANAARKAFVANRAGGHRRGRIPG